LKPERFDRLKVGGFARGVEAEETPTATATPNASNTELSVTTTSASLNRLKK
jgi:hypothetical protein